MSKFLPSAYRPAAAVEVALHVGRLHAKEHRPVEGDYSGAPYDRELHHSTVRVPGLRLTRTTRRATSITCGSDVFLAEE